MDFGMKLNKTVLKFGIKGWPQQHGILKTRCISDFLTNYVEGVIKELEKYPEEKLADCNWR